MDAVSIEMHIDRTHEVAMSAKPAATARPGSAPGLVLMPADRTPAAGASFAAGRARDAGPFRFMGEVVDVAAVFPLGHAAIVMPSFILIAHAMRIADEERSHLVLDAEVDDRPGGLVPQVTHASLGTAADLILRALQFLPAPGMLCAAAVLFGELAELSASLPLERADAAPSDDERFGGRGGDGGQVYLTQVNGCLHHTRRVFRLRDFQADVQFEAPVPDERAGSGVVRQVERQDQRRVALAHRQNDASLFPVDGLRRPLDRVEALRSPGVLHVHLRVLLAKPAGRLNRALEGAKNGLHRLAMQGKSPLGEPVQIILVGPAGMAHSGLLVGIYAHVPGLGLFPLRLIEAAEERWRKVIEPIDANCFHTRFFLFFASKTVIYRVGETWAGLPAPSNNT